jgi:hypothetical protein
MNYDYEGPKKWVSLKGRSETRRSPRSAPKKAKKTISVERVPIDEGFLYDLYERYSLPKKAAGFDQQMLAETLELRGWLEKPDKGFSLATHHWARIRQILDHAAGAGNMEPFFQFVSAWNSWKTKSPNETPVFDDSEAGRLAKSIYSLIPQADPNRTPGSPRFLWVIESILKLQRKLGRAPTQTEIVKLNEQGDSEGKGSVDESEVSRIAGELKLRELLSLE